MLRVLVTNDDLLNTKRDISISEIDSIRTDMIHSRRDVQRVIVYTLALASLSTALVGEGFVDSSGKIFHISSLVISIVFLMLALNYVGNARQYLSASKYVADVSRQIRLSFKDQRINISDEYPIMYYEDFNRTYYSSRASQFVLIITFGIQSVFPIFFSIVGIFVSYFSYPYYSLESTILCLVIISLYVMWSIAIFFAVSELRGAIRTVQPGSNGSGHIDSPAKQEAARASM